MSTTFHSVLTDALFDKPSTLAVMSGDPFQMTLTHQDQLDMKSAEWLELLTARGLLTVRSLNKKSFLGLQKLLDIPLYLTHSMDCSSGSYSVSPFCVGQTPNKTLSIVHIAHVSLTDEGHGIPLLGERQLNGLSQQDTWRSILSSQMKGSCNDWLKSSNIALPSYGETLVFPMGLRAEDRARCKVPLLRKRQAASGCLLSESGGRAQLDSEIKEGNEGFLAGLVGIIRDV